MEAPIIHDDEAIPRRPAKATHVASGAEDEIEVRIHEETHDSSHRYRYVDASAAFAGAASVGQEGRKRQ